MFLCSGVVIRAWFRPGNNAIIIVAAIIVILIITDAVLSRSRDNVLSGIAINAAFILTGILLYSAREDSFSSLRRERSVFICTLSDYPLEKENSIMLKVRIDCRRDEGKCLPVKGSMVIYNRKDSSLMSFIPGDRLNIRCTPLAIRNRNNPYEFNYRLYMENRGIRYYSLTETSDVTRLPVTPHRNLSCRALIIRQGIINIYRKLGIKGENLAVVAAITLGQKNLLDEDRKKDFATAGVIHVMAVSGLHVMILSLFVMNILSFLKRRFNISRIVLTLAVMWMFAFITGLTTSVVRASLMFTFIWSGYLLRRKLNPLNSLMASAFILIVINPGIIFDTGFLLSYSAVTFILVFYHDLYTTLHFSNRVADRIWQMTVVAIVAQAGTMPLTIAIFNRFPTYFLLANSVIVPLAALIVISGCLIPLVSPLFPLAKSLALFLNRLTDLTMLITEKTANLPYSSVSNAGMPPVECFLLLITIFLSGYFLLKKRTIRAIYPLISLLVLVSYHTYNEYRVSRTGEIIVYDVPGSVSIGIRTGRSLNLYSDSPVVADEVSRHCSTLHLKIVRYPLSSRPLILGVGKEKVLIGNQENKLLFDDADPDIIILTGKDTRILYEPEDEHVKGIPVISSSGAGSAVPGEEKVYSYTGRVHSVKKSGAFIKSI